MIASIYPALTGFVSQMLPEVILGVFACVLFLGSTFAPGRKLWGLVALLGIALAGMALYRTASTVPTLDEQQSALTKEVSKEEAAKKSEEIASVVFAAPIQMTRLSLFFSILTLATGVILVLVSWNDPEEEHAGEYHGCLLLILAGTSLTASANDLITLFLALELVSIPTYVLLYMGRTDIQGRTDTPAQEAAIKYFLLSIFSSALLLFGFSYLYGVTGTTNIPGIVETLVKGRNELAEMAPAARSLAGWPALTLVALVMVVAGLGFRITAVPFHFYAPDVYQGTTTPAAAILAFIPKIVGFAALLKLLGLVPSVIDPGSEVGRALGDQVPVLLWIMAAVTMSLGNVLALLQDNIRRMLAYSSVAHAGYMLIGLAVAPRLDGGSAGTAVGGIEAMLFYLIAYGAMTIGAFAVLYYLETPSRRVENVDDLAGLSKTHPGMALLMLVFLFSLIGMPLTAGFAGKFMLFWDAMGLSGAELVKTGTEKAELLEHIRLYRILAVIGALNAAIGGWYYLRVAAVMYLREAVTPLPKQKPATLLASIWVCAAVTLALGVYPAPVVDAIRKAVPRRATPEVQRAEELREGKVVAEVK